MARAGKHAQICTVQPKLNLKTRADMCRDFGQEFDVGRQLMFYLSLGGGAWSARLSAWESSHRNVPKIEGPWPGYEVLGTGADVAW
jgi:hypothetical protein